MLRRALLLSLVAAVVAPAASAGPPLPTSMAAIGDSITRATDVCCWYGDHPAQSWSTGGGAFDGIRSHYERIRAVQPAINGRNYNDARAGAKMRDAPGQAAVFGFVHDAHATGPQLPDDAIVAEGGAKHGGRDLAAVYRTRC